MTHPAANIVAQQVGWFACVIGAAHGHPFWGAGVALALTAAHVAASPDRAGELQLLLFAAAFGLVAETALQAGHLLTYQSRWTTVPWLCPPWILALWIQFATTLRHGMRWLLGRPWMAVVLGAVGGPLAFRAGEGLGAVTFAPVRWTTFAALSAVWAVAMPALTGAARRLDQRAALGGLGKNGLVRST